MWSITAVPKFASLSYQWDVDKIDQTRYGWLASVENEQTTVEIEEAVEERFGAIDITFVDGYRQIDVARLWALFQKCCCTKI